ncbi:MAG: protein-disulfide reductase DsbD family protein [Limisphaerales bacterium]
MHYSGVKVLLRTLLAFFFVVSAHAAANTQWRLVLSTDAVQPGQTVMAGLEMKIPTKWHTYWRNPGDSGIATSIKWTLPPGVKAGEIQWPVPKKFTETQGEISLVTYIYEDTAVLLIPLEISKDIAPGPLQIHGKVSWQECEQLCVQGHTDVTATLNIGTETKPSADAALIDQWRQRLPTAEPKANAKAYWESATATGDERVIVIEWQTADTNADFFSYKQSGFDVAGASQRNSDAGNIRMLKKVTKSEGEWPASLTGVLVTGANEGYEVTLPIGSAPVAVIAGADANAASLIKMLFYAFLGGLILNIMPCVLPVIALKVLGFVNQAKEEPRLVRKLGFVYGVGVLVSFAALALIAIGVQKAGGVPDWGTAFRNPIFRVLITILITLVALNLFGLFEVTLHGGTLGAAAELTAREGYPGAFFNGVLATILATPCTAPFLVGALAFAFTQPPPIIVLTFLVVGIGLALPFVVICLDPRLLKFLPKPGVWMHHFKVAMGFPVLATAMWLFWLTATRMGKSGVLWFGLFLVILAFATWVWGQFVQRTSKRRGIAMIAALLVLVVGYTYILEGKLAWRSNGMMKEAIAWKPWSSQAVEKARRDGHPVLVDFTADTCLNCQFNKLTSIEVAPTEKKLKEIGAETFVADYTDQSPVIARELQRYGRPGVPLVLVFPTDLNKPAIVLPPLLTKSIVLHALDEAVGTVAPTQSASR